MRSTGSIAAFVLSGHRAGDVLAMTKTTKTA
jgi:hypothetical protein